MSEAPGAHQRAEVLRRSLVGYVRAVHEAYRAAAEQRGVDAATLPLAGDPFTVAAVAAGQLHLLATRDPLPPLQAHEAPIDDRAPPLRWQVRFLDVTVVPALAQIPENVSGDDLLAVIGVQRTLYHLLVNPAATLDGHQAMHAGTGLANAHLATGP